MIFIPTYENRNPYIQSKQSSIKVIKGIERTNRINKQKKEQEHPTKGKRFDKSI